MSLYQPTITDDVVCFAMERDAHDRSVSSAEFLICARALLWISEDHPEIDVIGIYQAASEDYYGEK